MKRRTFFRSTLAATAIASLPRIGADQLSAFYGVEPGSRVPDIDAVTGDGGQITIKGTDVEDLVARLRGRVLLSGDAGYDDARALLNPSFDKHPALVVQPMGVADIQATVSFAREYNLLTAVKCGGHSLSGKSSCDLGLQVDLSRFRSVRVDPSERRAWVTGGSLLGAVDHEAMAHGLVTTCGTVSHTGVSGLTLGGGFGRLARRFGLAIDNVRSFDVVTADGELRHASAETNPELYWGLRGGGGNFGIVTSFEFELHPMPREVVGGPVMFPMSRAKEVLALYADYAVTAPEELYLDYVMATSPAGDGFAGFVICYSGPTDRAEAALAPIRALGTPMMEDVKAVDYVELQRSGDVDDPRAMGTYMKGGFVKNVSPGLISAIVENIESHPGRGNIFFLQHAGGAIDRVANDATAFSHRGALATMMAGTSWPSDSDGSEHIAYSRSYWSKLEPFTAGFYSNDVTEDTTAAQVNANYGVNYDRLVALKRRYDPTNLFRLNANVQP